MKTLTRSQKAVLYIGITIFVFMGVCPPWVYTLDARSEHWTKDAGYSLIIVAPNRPPYGYPQLVGTRLDLSRLLVQWICVAATTGGLFFWAGLRIADQSASTPLSIKEEALQAVIREFMRVKAESPKVEVKTLAEELLKAVDSVAASHTKPRRTFGWGTITATAGLAFFGGAFIQFCISNHSIGF